MWPASDETENLLEDARNGDEDAVNRLLGRHRESIRRLVSLRIDPALARRVDASDIVQDVLLEANRRLADYLQNPVMPFHLWLRHLAKDHVIGAHRRHRLARKRSVDRERPLAGAYGDNSSLQLAPHLVAGGLTPAAAAIRHELEQRFVAALEHLSEGDREIILMRHFEQLSNQDVARTHGITEPAASMRYLRALRRLRSLLGTDQPSQNGEAAGDR